jgi:hypothetical protein
MIIKLAPEFVENLPSIYNTNFTGIIVLQFSQNYKIYMVLKMVIPLLGKNIYFSFK